MDRKLNKAEAGFQILQLLSAVDGDFSHREDDVIREYLIENYPFHVSLDEAVEYLSTLPKEDYILHFQKCMDDFYLDSIRDERVKFLKFAIELVKADDRLTQEENIFIKTLFDAWENEHA